MKKRILMISPVPSHPQNSGSRARIYSLGQSIKKLGHDFYFAHIGRETGEREAMATCWGDDFFIPLPYVRRNPLPMRIKRKIRSFYDKEAYFKFDLDAWYDGAVDIHLRKIYRKYQFDVVIVEYVFFSKALLCFPDSILKVIDTHDAMTQRHKQYVQKEKKYSWYSTTAAQEKKGLDRADVIIAIQDGERQFFKGLSRKKIVTVGHMVKVIPQASERPDPDKILFIGSTAQSNIDAIQFFIEDIFPRVKEAVPNAILYVAGKVCGAIHGNRADVVTLGEIADLDSAYDMTDVVINPTRTGTGLKIKNIEAMGYSKPLVTTTIGAAGLEGGAASAFLVADTAREFSDAVVRILHDPSLYDRLAVNGNTFAMEWNQQQMDSLQAALNVTTSS